MIANIILFVAGSGGNFLARILTLDPATIPIGGDGETASERSELYHYSNIDKLLNKKYNNFNNNGLSDWVEIELNKMFFPMTLGVEKITKMNKILVEPIHPSHYETKLGYFGKDDILKILYIDPIDCEQWITTQRIHKGVVKDNKSFDLQLNRTKFEIEDLHKKSSEAYPKIGRAHV